MADTDDQKRSPLDWFNSFPATLSAARDQAAANEKKNSLRAAASHGYSTTAETPSQVIECDDGYGFFRNVSQVGVVADYIARHMSGLRLYAAEIDEEGNETPTENTVARDLVTALRDESGEQSSLLDRGARNLVIAGQFYLVQMFCESDDARGIDSHFAALSTHELRLKDAKRREYERSATGARSITAQPDVISEPGDGEEPKDGQVFVWRIWERDPEYSARATSIVLRAQDTLSRIVRLNDAINAKSVSRFMQSGIVYMNGVEDERDKMLRDRIYEAISARVEGGDQAYSATAGAPIVMALGEDGEIGYLEAGEDTVYQEIEAREKEIEIFANVSGVPKAILLGSQDDANHWSLQGMTEEGMRATLPIRRLFLEGITSAYLQPNLKARGVPDPWRYVVAADDSHIVSKPDRSSIALEAFDRKLIGAERARMDLGYTEDDAWDCDIDQDPCGVEEKQLELPIAETPTERETEPDTQPALPDEEVVEAAVRLASLETAVRMATIRTRQVIGAKVRNELRKRDERLAAATTGADSSSIPSLLSGDDWKLLGDPNLIELGSGSSAHLLEDELRRIIGEGCRECGELARDVERFGGASACMPTIEIPPAMRERLKRLA